MQAQNQPRSLALRCDEILALIDAEVGDSIPSDQTGRSWSPPDVDVAGASSGGVMPTVTPRGRALVAACEAFLAATEPSTC